jgi:hypothetical protein
MAEGFYDLESSGYAYLTDLMWGQTHNALPQKVYPPGIGPKKTRDEIEQRGFARAVRAYEPEDFAGIER